SNRTLSMCGDFYREAIRSSDGDCQPFMAAVGSAIPSGRLAKWANILTGNALGFEMFSIGNESIEGALQRSFVVRAQHSLLQVRVAMARYRLGHGDWPPTLNALVPAYLEAVPTDPMDGKPLRYNSQKKVVYSIGTDFVDHRGLAPGGR